LTIDNFERWYSPAVVCLETDKSTKRFGCDKSTNLATKPERAAPKSGLSIWFAPVLRDYAYWRKFIPNGDVQKNIQL
jgi:hypothetical protein